MNDDVRAFWTVAPGRGEIRHEPLGVPGDSDVVVRALYSGISRGTEALVFAGRVPQSEWQRMRAPFQAGEFPGPVKYGYASVGRVERGSRDLEGRTVFALYPHQTRYIVPARAVHLVPDHVTPERAVLAANVETALNGVWDAGPAPGDCVVVIGGGAVGCLVAWLVSRIPACKVLLVDVNPSRAEVAKALGVDFSLPSGAAGDADVVIHASGTPEGLDLALQCAGFEAKVVEMSWFGDRAVPLSLGGAFHSRRLTITSSQVGHVAPSHRPRWDSRRRLQLALQLLGDTVLDALITGESSFDDLPVVMSRLSSAPGQTLCHRVRYA